VGSLIRRLSEEVNCVPPSGCSHEIWFQQGGGWAFRLFPWRRYKTAEQSWKCCSLFMPFQRHNPRDYAQGRWSGSESGGGAHLAPAEGRLNSRGVPGTRACEMHAFSCTLEGDLQSYKGNKMS
jgi:hypothetical protein